MDDTSIFPDKDSQPSEQDLADKLGPVHKVWKNIREIVMVKYPDGLADWHYTSKKYGWSFRIKDKKRAIIYMLHRDRYFKVAMVFGEKATGSILVSHISDQIKTELKNARPYAEGRGIRIDVKDDTSLCDIIQLIDIKLSH